MDQYHVFWKTDVRSADPEAAALLAWFANATAQNQQRYEVVRADSKPTYVDVHEVGERYISLNIIPMCSAKESGDKPVASRKYDEPDFWRVVGVVRHDASEATIADISDPRTAYQFADLFSQLWGIPVLC